MTQKYLADVTSAGKPAHGPATALNPHGCPYPLGDCLTTRKCDGCGTAIDTSFDDPDHTCGLCYDCWSDLTPEQQKDRDRQVIARLNLTTRRRSEGAASVNPAIGDLSSAGALPKEKPRRG